MGSLSAYTRVGEHLVPIFDEGSLPTRPIKLLNNSLYQYHYLLRHLLFICFPVSYSDDWSFDIIIFALPLKRKILHFHTIGFSILRPELPRLFVENFPCILTTM